MNASKQRAGLAVAVALAIGFGACSSDDDTGESGATTNRGASAAPETTEFAADWPAPGRDLRGTRAVVDSPITSETIDGLEEAWRVELPGVGGYGNASSGPLVLGDTVIVQDLGSDVRAIDLETGEVRWTRTYDLFTIGPNGPAAGYGRVFVAKGAREIAALDRDTGEEEWTVELPRTETEGIDIQPQVFGGLVYASTVPVSVEGIYAGGDRGVLYALDVESGDIVWEFDTVEGDDVWGNSEVNSGGGAWYPPSVDAEAGVVYWGIANPAPFPGTPEFPNGASRPGPNLYTESVVALEAATGELLWYRQAIEHDLFDRDLVHTMIVEDTNGRDVIVGTGKLGRVIGHDPSTGEVLWDTPVGKHENDELEALDGPTPVLPGTFGGVLTPPAAAEGVVYVATLNAPTTLSPDESAYIGSEIGTMPGEVAAIDATDGTLLWSTEVDGDPLGGATVLGDLVLTATFQGTIYALDRETGEIVWTEDATGGVNAWPAAAGDTLLWPVGMAEPPALVAWRLP